MREKILFVDDDVDILETFKRKFYRHFRVETAESGARGLELIRSRGPFAVVVSDMRMPEMDGTAFLAQVREQVPESVRMLLTGQADFSDAIAVVNQGHIFRFLTKPCPHEILLAALHDGIAQFRLLQSEKELLEKTLNGTIKLLVDLLSIVSPEAFSRANRVRALAGKIATRLNMEKIWQVDIAVMLAQIGSVALSPEVAKRKQKGKPLSPEERELYMKHMEVGRDLLKNIPRLEEVAEAIVYQEKHFNGLGLPQDSVKGKDIPVIARILKVVFDYDDFLISGKTGQQAYQEMRLRASWYDPDILAALNAELLAVEDGFVVRDIKIADLKAGMVLAGNITNKWGNLLVVKGSEISDIMRIRLQNSAKAGVIGKSVKILEWVALDDA